MIEDLEERITNDDTQRVPGITSDEFEEGFGENLQQALDVSTWQSGEDLGAIYRRIEAEVAEAVRQEAAHQTALREQVFPRLADYDGAPADAGVYAADLRGLRRAHDLLFRVRNGVEAADGTLVSHETLPLTIFQIGVGLVSYQGGQGTWSHRLFRRDLRMSEGDPVERLLKVLERREQRDGLNHLGRRDTLARLARRGIMAHAERAILLQRSQAVWRVGHGNPAPLELLTGSGSLDLMIESTKIVRQLIQGHKRFLFVASEPADRFLLTIGEALRPLEYAIVRSFRDTVYDTIERAHYRSQPYTSDTSWDGEELTPIDWILRFRDEVAPEVVVGVYRASRLAPPQVFYAHTDHVHVAAHLALADSMLQAHRGFPMLIDLADSVCRTLFGQQTLDAPVSTAYAGADAPFRFLSERATLYR